MTGVLEIGAIAAAVGAMGWHSKQEQQQGEESTAVSLYRRSFGADLLEVAPDRVSVVAAHLPVGLDPHAAACIRTIERYQEERKKWFLLWSSGVDCGGDVRTRVLEEFKQWLLSLAEGSVDIALVSTRVEYCWQFLLRPVLFETKNAKSFLQTMAEVCRQLEALVRQLVGNRRNCWQQLGRLLSLGREVGLAMIPVLSLALADGRLHPGHPETCLRPEDYLADARRDVSVKDDALAAEAAPGIVWDTDIGRVLRALLRSRHFAELVTSDEEAAALGTASAAGTAAGGDASASASALASARATWAAELVGERSGLASPFRTSAQAEARAALLDSCGHLDRLVFFLAALRPYHYMASLAGDLAMCWLGKCLSHLLQEIEKAMVQLRQARLEVMHAAHVQLQDLARQGLPDFSSQELRWMQRLRHIGERRLDELHRAVCVQCTELLAMTSEVWEAEMREEARRGLEDIASTFESAEFQSRCRLALPDALVEDMRVLRHLTALGGLSSAERLADR